MSERPSRLEGSRSHRHAEIQAPAAARRKSGGQPRSRQASRPLREWLEEAKASTEKSETAGLPLFDWAEQKGKRRPELTEI